MSNLFEIVSVVDGKSKLLLNASSYASPMYKNENGFEVWLLNEMSSSLRILRESVIWKDGVDLYLIDSVVRHEDEEYKY